MKKVLVALLVLCLHALVSAEACTTILITKGATEDGSVFVGHTDDGEMGDPRLIYVPAADHPVGSMRAVYYDGVALGDRPYFNQNVVERFVGEDRGPQYAHPKRPQSVPIGFIPQVEHTYAYFDGNYGIMNEHQLMFGECTDGSKVTAEPEPGKLIFYSSELSRVALERCRTAREAVELIGQLIDQYGYYGTGETLPVADPNEGWVIEMAPSPEGVSGLWVAKKVPDGEVFVAANEFRIRDVDPDNKDMLFSTNLHAVAQKHGWWKPEDGLLDWLRTVSEGEYNHPYYSLRRVWRLQSRLAPSQPKSPWVEDGFTRAYPFSIKPDNKLSVRDVMSLFRDHYEGTEFDLTKGIAAGPFGCPYRYGGPMDAQGDTADPNSKKEGAWERPISIFRCTYSFVCQGRSWLPDPIGGVLWWGPDQPATTCYMPIYAGVKSIADCLHVGDPTVVDQTSAWWIFNSLGNYAALKFSYMIEDIRAEQDSIENAAVAGIRAMDQKALDLYRQDPAKAAALLTDYCANQVSQIVHNWGKYAWTMVARYSDGFINSPGKMAEEVGYPEEWYNLTGWRDGPTTYAPRTKTAPAAAQAK